jgi:hypothetical protein
MIAAMPDGFVAVHDAMLMARSGEAAEPDGNQEHQPENTHRAQNTAK